MAQALSVLVELRAPRANLKTSAIAVNSPKLPSFALDQRYPCVVLKPSTPSLEMSLDAGQEQLVLIRGTIELERLDELRTLSSVGGVYLDTAVAPFDCRCGQLHCDEWVLDIGAGSPIDCPIPPCDCQPMQARGSLLDVAAYLGADRIWQEGITGDGIVIGVVDGGIWAEGRADSNLSGLVPCVIGGWPAANWGTFAGWRGHGNMVAIDALGIAPRASLYDIRVSDSSQNGARISNAIAAIHWAVEQYRAAGTPQILCCGWGIYQQSHDPSYAVDANHPLTRKIVEAMDEGILVLFAAGNGAQSCPANCCGDDTGPGRSIWGANGHPRVMTVGAVNMNEQLIGYSSQGPAALDKHKPDFCGISHFSGYFCSDSGTSVACAVAAGIVALLKQARPTLTQEAAKRLLKSTAKDIGPPGWDRHSGSGIIQAKAAFDALVGHCSLDRGGAARLERLKAENHCLRELFIELAIERRMRINDLGDNA